ncbi:shikimate kinase [Pelovirga terrestris]|uniref:Shikimate kinase n=1 Tax=Pelovirga terrestris TaxID=2771352 RepID=A0A8J6QPI2_9BACT|nr:shikimate kinase [Pelovirga terrestris]MBD1399460.1 shikimate kinase [Pelovirga terrestris]
MSQTNIILTGFMGSGKSTVGRALAARLGATLIDTDQVIEQRTNCRISEIFARQGEAAFRLMEADLARELAARHDLVIATGGGFFTNQENISALQQSGRIFCLTATPQDILNRVKKQGQIRPLLQQSNPLEQINQLLRERESVYRQFPQIPTSGQTIDQVVDTIINLMTSDSY